MTTDEVRYVVQENVCSSLEEIYGEVPAVDWHDSQLQLDMQDVLDKILDGEGRYGNDRSTLEARFGEDLEDDIGAVKNTAIQQQSHPSRGRSSRATAQDSKDQATRFTGEETKQEKIYREIVMGLIGQELAYRQDVISFRRCIGGLMTLTDALELLASEVAGIITFEDCERYSLCPAVLRGHVLSRRSVTQSGSSSVDNFGQMAGWSREEFVFEVEISLPSNQQVFTISHSPDTYKCLARRKHIGQTYVHSEENRVLAAVVPPQENDPKLFKTWRTVSGFGASIIGIALGIASSISESAQWEAWDSLRWLLTGRLPESGTHEGVRWPLLTVRKNRLSYKDRLLYAVGDSYSHSVGPSEMVIQPWAHAKQIEAVFSRTISPNRKPLPSLAMLDLFRRVQHEMVLSGTLDGPFGWAKFVRTPSFAEWETTHGSKAVSEDKRGAIRTAYTRVEKYLSARLLWLRPSQKLLHQDAQKGTITVSAATGAYLLPCPKCGYGPSQPITARSPCPKCALEPIQPGSH